MNLLGIVLLAQIATPPQQTLPVLAFPEQGLDDSAAYQGYQTRFFRDAAGNTVQIYLDRRTGRVVHLWADSENESIGFTARDAHGRPAPLRWDGAGATISRSAATRVLEHRLVADASEVRLGWFLLGSMRVERDFQYAGSRGGRDRAPFGEPPATLPEIRRLLAALERLAPAERRRHLALLHASDARALRSRLQPALTTRRSDSTWVARLIQPSLDGRDSLVLELRTDPRLVAAVRVGASFSLRARSGSEVPFTVRIATSGRPLTPLSRDEIFNSTFLAFLAAARSADGSSRALANGAGRRARWLERQVLGMELLASREKLMAGLPNYATYFGRDMLLTALMMQPIWRDAMPEFAIASVLRKLSPLGQVSHEEALGGQAIREAAPEYAALVDQYLHAVHAGDPRAAAELLARARAVLGDLRRVRENYHMIDGEFQFPVLVARWLGDPHVTADRKRTFLFDSSDGGSPRLTRLVRELGLVSRLTAAYAEDPIASNLVSFPPRDSARWQSASWRDSNDGYAGGRYAMDVNAIWAPHALESIGRILEALRTLGISLDSLGSGAAMPDLDTGTPLGRYARDSLVLRRAIAAWRGASRHFVVRLGPADVRSHVATRIAAMPNEERRYWSRRPATSAAEQDSLAFLALALDGGGRPIGVANTDPATRLFLGDSENGNDTREEATDPHGQRIPAGVLRDVRLFVRPYPVGLFIDGVGPVVANDAYAPPMVWQAFERDPYHGPRVVWGREVNLFLLGVTDRIAAASGAAPPGDPALAPYMRELRGALEQVMSAVEASGFRSELWSYKIAGGRLIPVRYGTGSDVQLWSTTDLAVQFALAHLAP